MYPMLNQIVARMVQAIEQNQDSKKFILYSAHDITVRPLLVALGVPEYR